MDNQMPPPYSGTPPPPPSYAAYPRPKSALGWKIAVVLLLALLGLSVLINVGSLFHGLVQSSGGLRHAAGPHLERVVLEDHDSNNDVLVLPVEGIILSQGFGSSGYGLVEFVQDQLDRAAKDNDIKAVILKINSPGGEVLASDDISRALKEFQKESGKPVIAAMGSVAASGGYYVSAPCRWIVANELTITGSIGVIMQSYNYRGLMDKVGLHPEVFKSGKFKDMLSGDKKESEITTEERAMVQRMVDETFDRFKKVVATGRSESQESNQNNSDEKGRKLAEDWTEYADGRILSGKEAYTLGFVDELGNMDTAHDRALKLTGLSDANLVQFQQPLDFSSLFRLLGESGGAEIKVDLGFNQSKLPMGHLYFLAPTFIH